MNTLSLKRITKDYKELISYPLDNIFFKLEEENIFTGYAIIIGRKDTPYEFGYYLFKFIFPKNYPFSPPKVTFLNYDGETRFNPNLYITGEVCLSILNTWEGEKWSSCQTIKSILMTLFTFVLNEEPIFNEPGVNRNNSNIIPYHEVIFYKNIEVSILKYILKENLPEPLHEFYDIMKKSLLDNKDTILENISGKKNKRVTLNLYCNKCVFLDYQRLKKKIELITNDL